MAAPGDHHVEFALIHRLQQLGRNADPDAERDAWVAHRKRPQDIHQPDVAEAFGQADPDRAFAGSAKQLHLRIMIEREDGARVTQQQFSVRRARDRARGARKQVAAGLLFLTPQMRTPRTASARDGRRRA